MTQRPDPVTHHREPVHAVAVRLDPDNLDDAPGRGDFQVIAVVTSAVYGDYTAPATPSVDLGCPTWGLDDHGRIPLSVDQARALAEALRDAAHAVQDRVER